MAFKRLKSPFLLTVTEGYGLSAQTELASQLGPLGESYGRLLMAIGNRPRGMTILLEALRAYQREQRRDAAARVQQMLIALDTDETRRLFMNQIHGWIQPPPRAIATKLDQRPSSKTCAYPKVCSHCGS